jgi:hypothetical protein
MISLFIIIMNFDRSASIIILLTVSFFFSFINRSLGFVDDFDMSDLS